MTISDTTASEDNKTPDQIRADIEETRSNLGTDVDALADKVKPSSIAHRQTEKVKGKLGSLKEAVMGAAHDGTESVAGTGNHVVSAAKGSAIGVGLAAFGIGLLVSALLPASDREKDIATDLKDRAAPAIDSVKEAAKDAAQNLREPAQDAVASVKDAAQEATSTVKDEAQSSAADVKDSVRQN